MVDKALVVEGVKQLAIDRLSRMRKRMEADGVDAVVIASPENVLYATGYESMGATINRRYAYAALVTQADVLLVAPASDFAPAIDGGLAPEDIHPFGTFFFSGDTASAHNTVRDASFDDAFSGALSRLPACALVLVERAFLPDAAVSALPSKGQELRDASAWMLALRREKLPFEIALLRTVTEITQRAIDAGIAAAAIGVTDKEVAAVVASEMSLAGGLPRNLTVVGGLRSALADVMSTERPLDAGDLLRFDVGCSFYGYKSDMARTAVIGQPTDLQASRYAALLAGLEAEMALIRAGVKAADIFRRGVEVVEQSGLKPFRRQHIGHAIGMAVYEAPVITPDSQDMLTAGSTFCIETPYYEPGWGGMMVEDTGLVTEDGFELFSTSDRSLRIVPA